MIPSCKVKWTQIKTLAEYQHFVSEARRVAGSRTLYDWELEQYQKTIKDIALTSNNLICHYQKP
jgi:hypothetical protein